MENYKIKSRLYDYSDACILVKRSITITGGPGAAYVAEKSSGKTNKGVIFKNCAPFTDCIYEVNNTQVDNARDLDVVI